MNNTKSLSIEMIEFQNIAFLKTHRCLYVNLK